MTSGDADLSVLCRGLTGEKQFLGPLLLSSRPSVPEEEEEWHQVQRWCLGLLANRWGRWLSHFIHKTPSPNFTGVQAGHVPFGVT